MGTCPCALHTPAHSSSPSRPKLFRKEDDHERGQAIGGCQGPPDGEGRALALLPPNLPRPLPVPRSRPASLSFVTWGSPPPGALVPSPAQANGTLHPSSGSLRLTKHKDSPLRVPASCRPGMPRCYFSPGAGWTAAGVSPRGPWDTAPVAVHPAEPTPLASGLRLASTGHPAPGV